MRNDLELTKAEKKNLLGENIELSQSLSNAKESVRQLTATVAQLQAAGVAPVEEQSAGDKEVVDCGDENSRSSGSTFSIVRVFQVLLYLVFKFLYFCWKVR